MVRLAVVDNTLFHERRSRAGLHACTAGDALGVEEVLTADARRYFRFEATALNRQCKRALDFVAGADTSRADDALARIELEVGVAMLSTGASRWFSPSNP